MPRLGVHSKVGNHLRLFLDKIYWTHSERKQASRGYCRSRLIVAVDCRRIPGLQSSSVENGASFDEKKQERCEVTDGGRFRPKYIHMEGSWYFTYRLIHSFSIGTGSLSRQQLQIGRIFKISKPITDHLLSSLWALQEKVLPRLSTSRHGKAQRVIASENLQKIRNLSKVDRWNSEITHEKRCRFGRYDYEIKFYNDLLKSHTVNYLFAIFNYIQKTEKIEKNL